MSFAENIYLLFRSFPNDLLPFTSLFENMDRICDDKYIPTPTDVLRARVRTNGIIETNFRVNDTIIR